MEIDWKDHHHRKPIACPWCKHEITTSSQVTVSRPVTHKRPVGGDAVMCIECGRISIFVGTSELRRPTYEEYLQAFNDNPVLKLVKLAWELSIGAEQRAKRAKHAKRRR